MAYIIALRSKETGRQGHVPKLRRNRYGINNLTVGRGCQPLRFDYIKDAREWLAFWNEHRIDPSKTFFEASVKRVHKSYFTTTGG